MRVPPVFIVHRHLPDGCPRLLEIEGHAAGDSFSILSLAAQAREVFRPHVYIGVVDDKPALRAVGVMELSDFLATVIERFRRTGLQQQERSAEYAVGLPPHPEVWRPR